MTNALQGVLPEIDLNLNLNDLKVDEGGIIPDSRALAPLGNAGETSLALAEDPVLSAPAEDMGPAEDMASEIAPAPHEPVDADEISVAQDAESQLPAATTSVSPPAPAAIRPAASALSKVETVAVMGKPQATVAVAQKQKPSSLIMMILKALFGIKDGNEEQVMLLIETQPVLVRRIETYVAFNQNASDGGFRPPERKPDFVPPPSGARASAEAPSLRTATAAPADNIGVSPSFVEPKIDPMSVQAEEVNPTANAPDKGKLQMTMNADGVWEYNSPATMPVAQQKALSFINNMDMTDGAGGTPAPVLGMGAEARQGPQSTFGSNMLQLTEGTGMAFEPPKMAVPIPVMRGMK